MDRVRNTENESKLKLFTNWDTKGITLYGCKFVNTDIGSYADLKFDRGTGIHSVDASMIIQNSISNGDYGQFNNLQLGIESLFSTLDPTNGIIVKRNSFLNNIYSIKLSGASSGSIFRNTFKMDFGTNFPTYAKVGYWGYKSGGVQISENNFFNTINGNQPNFYEIGAVINTSENYGGIYMLNTHSNTNIGCQTEGNNYKFNYKCNSHSNTKKSGINLNPVMTGFPSNPVSYLPFFGDCGINSNITLMHKRNNFISNTAPSADILFHASGVIDYVVPTLNGNPTEPFRWNCTPNVRVKNCAIYDENCNPIEPSEPNGWEKISKKNCFFDEKGGSQRT